MLATSWVRRRAWRWLRHDRDARWKLVVSRTARRFPVWWRTVAIEFHRTEEDAEQRQAQILRNWDSGQYSTRPPIGPRERRRLRLR